MSTPEPTKKPTVKHLKLQDVETLIRETRVLAIKHNQKLAERNAEALVITKKYAPDLEKLSAEIAAKELLITTWCEKNRQAQFGTAKTRKFTFGSVQFRTGSLKLLMLTALDWTENKIIAVLKKEKSTREFVRTEETINRAALIEAYNANKLTDAQLTAFGLEAVQEETCSLKLNLPSTAS